MSPAVLGWDKGGVNTKVARLEPGTGGPVIRSACLPFELKHDPAGLTPTLTEAARAVGGAATDLHAARTAPAAAVAWLLWHSMESSG